MKRPCRYCGKPTWSPHSPFCLAHRPSREQRQLWAMKDRASRGYGAAHKAVRERVGALVASGLATCARCGEAIAPGSAWDLGHTDDRTGYTGAEHSRCNRLAGARKGAAAANANRRTRRPDWLPRQAPEPAGKRRWSQNWNAPNPPPPDVVILGGD